MGIVPTPAILACSLRAQGPVHSIVPARRPARSVVGVAVVDCRLGMAAKRKNSTLATALFGHVRAWACLLVAAIAIGAIPAVVHATTLAAPPAAENSPLGFAGNFTPARALADRPQAPESPLESGFAYGQIVVDNAYATRGALPAMEGVNPWAGRIVAGETQTTMTMYRVWGGEAKQAGEWLTSLRPASAAEARAGLALPPGNAASFVSEVTVPAGTQVQVGTAAAAFGQTGGAIQMQLLERIPASAFGPGVPLP